MITFTIEVEKEIADKDFRFNDLKMFHQQCCGGTIAFNEDYLLRCKRCGTKVYRIKEKEKIEIIKTAIDGQVRNFGVFAYRPSKKIADVSVVQKK